MTVTDKAELLLSNDWQSLGFFKDAGCRMIELETLVWQGKAEEKTEQLWRGQVKSGVRWFYRKA